MTATHTVSSRQINWDGNKGTAEMSELRGFGRVWNDSCDEGITVVSTRTGAEKTFVVDHVDVKDGDIRFWVLKSVKGTRIVGDVTLTVFND